ncbi:MAG TPA: hypothetical protein VG269_24200 [Tepidisphaeraceae bacterium]|jgi:hypothetical protein|nr:hypothetical protein [Tepidisphaeraceae bacterium]
MDLTSSISNLQQSQTMGQVQIAVAAKIMNMARLEGNSAVQLIDAASAGVAKAGDQLVAAATGLGGQIDTYG